METPTIVIALAAVALAVGLVLLILRRRTTAVETTRLDEYGFYPFTTDDAGLVHFSPDKFDEAVAHFLSLRNPIAARELIVIGEQNRVRDTFSSEPLSRYKKLYLAYDGKVSSATTKCFSRTTSGSCG